MGPHPLLGLNPVQGAQGGIDVQNRTLPVENKPAITAPGQDFGVESKSVHEIVWINDRRDECALRTSFFRTAHFFFLFHHP
jgi:hypothetical protein